MKVTSKEWMMLSQEKRMLLLQEAAQEWHEFWRNKQ